MCHLMGRLLTDSLNITTLIVNRLTSNLDDFVTAKPGNRNRRMSIGKTPFRPLRDCVIALIQRICCTKYAPSHNDLCQVRGTERSEKERDINMKKWGCLLGSAENGKFVNAGIFSCGASAQSKL